MDILLNYASIEQLIDLPALTTNIIKFTDFIRFKDHRPDELISFRDCNGYLGMAEDYKSQIAEEARKELHISVWSSDLIGTGTISQYAVKAISKANNLVYSQQQVHFRNVLNPERAEYRKDAEEALYKVFKGDDEEEAFGFAVNVFGAKYDLISFLFFIKDDTRYLPISPMNFDKSFGVLNIDFKTSFNCNWENYNQYISLISLIGDILNDKLPTLSKVRLIDAHSFVWILHQDDYNEWSGDYEDEKEYEERIEKDLQRYAEGNGRRHLSKSLVYSRSAEVVRVAKERANGICQLCKQPAPFKDKKGNPYLEVHHIQWLSRGGKDSTDNAVALCPNCHTKMHVVDNPNDVKGLLNAISKESSKESGAAIPSEADLETKSATDNVQSYMPLLNDEKAKKCFESLKNLRSSFAEKEHLPAYCIFTDKALMRMAETLPMSKTQMLEIMGVGEKNYSKYGEQFIEVIKTFIDNSEHEENPLSEEEIAKSTIKPYVKPVARVNTTEGTVDIYKAEKKSIETSKKETVVMDGETYHLIRGKWVDFHYTMVSKEELYRLNALRIKNINLDDVDVTELIQVAQSMKDSDDFIFSKKLLETIFERSSDKKVIQSILPRYTSILRNIDQPREAIEISEKIISIYGKSIYSPSLFTSLAGAYCDIGDPIEARKKANVAMAMCNGNAGIELQSVYARIKTME